MANYKFTDHFGKVHTTYDGLEDVKCRKDLKMYSLETGEMMVVPAGTVITRIRHTFKKSSYHYNHGGRHFEYEPGVLYLPVDGKIVRGKSIFGSKK